MIVLDINQGGIPVSGPQFPDAVIESISFKDFFDGEIATDKYDVVVAGHILQLVDRRVLPDFVKRLKNLVHDMGEVHIYVPDMEWAAKMLIDNKPNPLIQYVLYGNEEYPHKSGFTLLWLRQLCESAQILVRYSTISAFSVKVGEENAVIPQLVILGVRNDSLFDPATAID